MYYLFCYKGGLVIICSYVIIFIYLEPLYLLYSTVTYYESYKTKTIPRVFIKNIPKILKTLGVVISDLGTTPFYSVSILLLILTPTGTFLYVDILKILCSLRGFQCVDYNSIMKFGKLCKKLRVMKLRDLNVFPLKTNKTV